ncbi:MAG: hypothetical protein KAU94_05475 [Verrucomicrobia bacterium]|nr:hypothetical protein [Verrucomicrobiota bacterium]
MADPVTEILKALKKQRDEIAVQVNLGKAEAKDEWKKLETKFETLTSDAKQRTQPLSGAVEDAAGSAGSQAKKVTNAALDLAAKELLDGYTKLKTLLNS